MEHSFFFSAKKLSMTKLVATYSFVYLVSIDNISEHLNESSARYKNFWS